MRVIFAGGGTGGHLYPGLAIARALVRLNPAAQPFFIGARRGIEARVMPETGFPFALLDLHPLYRRELWRNVVSARHLASSWFEAGAVMRTPRPAVVVGLGGYASGVALAWATAHGVPTVQQVGDATPGLAARAFSRWAKVLYLGFAEALDRLPRGRDTEVVITGNPIDPPPPDRLTRAQALARLGWPSPSGSERTVLVFGGSGGARAINEGVRNWVAGGLPADVRVIWATGYNQYESYRKSESAQVLVRPYLSPISDAYQASDLAVTRAGAMTCAELAAWGLPAILIPLPKAAADHQTGNARAVAAGGGGVVLPESGLTGSTLGATVFSVLDSPDRLQTMAAAAREHGRSDAAEVIARDILARFA